MTNAAVLDRDRWVEQWHEAFVGDDLDHDRWVPHYLPHWTTPERSRARYRVADGVLELRIEADQPAWLPDDGPMRVSNVQSGSWSGPAGSPVGQHRHRDDLRVVTPQPTRRLVTPSAGLVEVELRASPDPTCMLAFWLVGFEEGSPRDSGELCVAELFGHAVGQEQSVVRTGVKAHHDPHLVDDVVDVRLDIDTSQWHRYAVEWTARASRFYVDDRLVHSVPQGTGYPLQLMIDLFEFPEDKTRDPADYPRTAEVRGVRLHRPADGESRRTVVAP